MKWPWVSRVALDMALDENTRLRAQNDKLLDTVITLQRKSFGMKELAPTMPDMVQHQDSGWMTEEVPDNIVEIVEGFESSAIKDAIMLDIRNARRQGTPWDEIYRLMTETEIER